jgi:hypothetical protein
MIKNIVAWLVSFALMAHHLAYAGDSSIDINVAKKINDADAHPKNLLYGGPCSD